MKFVSPYENPDTRGKPRENLHLYHTPTTWETLGLQFKSTSYKGVTKILERASTDNRFFSSGETNEEGREKQERREYHLEQSDHYIAKGLGMLAGGTVGDLYSLLGIGAASKLGTMGMRVLPYLKAGVAKRIAHGALMGLAYGTMKDPIERLEDKDRTLLESLKGIAIDTVAFPALDAAGRVLWQVAKPVGKALVDSFPKIKSIFHTRTKSPHLNSRIVALDNTMSKQLVDEMMPEFTEHLNLPKGILKNSETLASASHETLIKDTHKLVAAKVRIRNSFATNKDLKRINELEDLIPNLTQRGELELVELRGKHAEKVAIRDDKDKLINTVIVNRNIIAKGEIHQPILDIAEAQIEAGVEVNVPKVVQSETMPELMSNIKSKPTYTERSGLERYLELAPKQVSSSEKITGLLKEIMPETYKELEKLGARGKFIKKDMESLAKEIIKAEEKKLILTEQASRRLLKEAMEFKDGKKFFDNLTAKIGSWTIAKYDSFKSDLIKDLGNAGLKVFEKDSLLWGKELNILNKGTEIPTGFKTAARTAKVLKSHSDKLVDRAQKAGINITELQGRVVKQTHDKSKLKDAGFDKWDPFIVPLMENPPSKDIREKMFNTLISFGPRSEGITLTGTEHTKESFYSLGVNLVKPKRRQIHFKSIEAAFVYNEEYGIDSFAMQYVNDAQTIIRDISLVEELGAYPEHTIKYVAKNLKQDIDVSRILQSLKLSHGNIHPEDALSKVGTMVRSLFASSVLGKMLLSSITDIPSVMVLKHQISMPITQNVLSTLRTTLYAVNSKQRKKMAEMYGVALDGFLENTTVRLGGDVQEVSNSLMKTIYSLSGLKRWDKAWKISNIKSLADTMPGFLSKPFHKLNTALQTDLKRNGIRETEWGLYHMASKHLKGAKTLQNQIKKLTLKEVGSAYKITNKSAIYVKRELLGERLNQFYHDFSNSAMAMLMRPADKIIVSGHKATITNAGLREAITSWFQFKSYPIAHTRLVLSSILRSYTPIEQQRAGILGVIKGVYELSGKNQAKVLIKSVGLYLDYCLLGYLVMELKDFASGKTNIKDFGKDVSDKKIRRVLDNNEMGGIFQILIGIVTADDPLKAMQEAALPASASYIAKGVRIAKTIGTKDFMPTLIKEGSSMVPNNNLLYIEAAYKKIFDTGLKKYYPKWHRKHRAKYKKR